ncbi:MAG: ribosome silencing factor [Rhodospirillaceae bacterium]
MPLAGDDILKLVTASLDDDKAQDLTVIDLHGKSDIADHMVIASGTSDRQVSAMADHLWKKLKGEGLKGLNVEGLGKCEWVLIDAGDVVVHLFRPEVREFYALEKLWADGPAAEAAKAAGAAHTR